MRKCYFFLLLLCAPFFVMGQTYGNEWINYTQKYYKIKIIKDGVYRIDSTAIANSGISLIGLNPKHFQLFYHGKEQYIYVQGENDGVFNKKDYIEFYAQHNDGALDSLVYWGISFNPNPYYSMFNDTSTYYLTWNSSVSNHRLIMQTDTTGFGVTQASYFIAETVNYGSTQFYGGARIPVGDVTATDPHYTRAEGWFFPELDLYGSQPYSLNISNVYTGVGSPSAVISTVVSGQSNAGFSPDHHLQIYSSWGGASPITDTLFGNDFPVFQKKYAVPASQLVGSVSITFNSTPSGLYSNILNTGNITAVSYIYAQYPHKTDMGGATNFMLFVPNASSNFLSLTNFTSGAGDTVRFYDFTDHYRFRVAQSGSSVKVKLLSSAAANRQCYITSDNLVNKVTKLMPVGNSTPGNNISYTGMFTSFVPASRLAPYIIISHPSLWSEASTYANFRGSKFDVVLANIEELYDQFGYGVEKDPLAIKRFCNYAVNNWRIPPADLFIIGKGLHTPLYRQDTLNYKACLVPSWGYPSSDVLLTAGFTNNISIKPAIPTGRIAAVNGTEVNNYLAKAQQYEANEYAQWMKKVIHFCGGSDANEQSYFLSNLNAYAALIENPYYGGFVYTFKKTSQAPIQLSLADSVTNIINNGVSIMTFFGHASGDNFDESLDVPGDYSNVNKYPLIIANSCFSGDMFQPVGGAVSSTSEQWVLDKKGCIGFIATDDIGIAGNLFDYTYTLYKNIAHDMYRKSIASCMQSTINTTQNQYDAFQQYTCMEIALHGDPGIILNAKDSLPDYAVNDTNVSFYPTNVTTQIDSFKLSIVVSNLAEAVYNQAVQVSITRNFPSGLTKNYLKTLTHLYYQDTIVMTLPVDKVNGVGLNHFHVSIDPANFYKEMTKVNNNTSVGGAPLWITSGDITPVFPYEFAIIPGDTSTLKASTGDPNAPLRKYIFQIDTSGAFNSPWLKSQVVSSKGGVVCAPSEYWTNTPAATFSFVGSYATNSNTNANRMIGGIHPKSAPLTFTDSTVYYWRVMRDTNDFRDFHFAESSFQYIKGKTGWAQANYYQFVNNQYTFLYPNIHQRNWLFSPTGKRLQASTYGMLPPYNSNQTTKLYYTGYTLDLQPLASNGCQYIQATHIVVIDPVTLQPWSPIPANHNFGAANNSINYGCVQDFKFDFWDTVPSQELGLYNMLQGNNIPNNYYILAYSYINGYFSHWADTNIRGEFRSLGENGSISHATDTVPWIFFAQKGNPGSVRETLGRNSNDSLQLTVNLSSKRNFGTMTTPLIGPAQKWDSLSWGQHPLLVNNRDSVRLNIIGVDWNGNSKTLMKGITPLVANQYISSISSKLYPYLQLMLYTGDTLTHTPSQMRKWQVFFTPVPELAVNPAIYADFYKDNISAGDTILYKTVVQNISSYPMDSTVYNSWLVDAGNSMHNLPQKHIKRLNPGDTAMMVVRTTSAALSGSSSIWIEVNPQYLPLTKPEQYHFNNFVKQSFVTIGDKTNPLLDVTFDGIHILDNDIVSAHPNILMKIMDENKFLALNDTSDFAIFIRNTADQTSKRVYFNSNNGSPQLTFTPAILPKNSCQINYTPSLADGTYELSVQATDRSHNASGSNNYKIDFQVINKSMISNILNYPNPFTTNTRFVFTLTGSQVPTYFKIQIMTITGRVVREITEGEIGPLHIGRNITEYAWDGTDQFGDRLANGIYLYRVVTSIDGQSIDHYTTGADQYFTKGVGKMYLLR